MDDPFPPENGRCFASGELPPDAPPSGNEVDAESRPELRPAQVQHLREVAVGATKLEAVRPPYSVRHDAGARAGARRFHQEDEREAEERHAQPGKLAVDVESLRSNLMGVVELPTKRSVEVEAARGRERELAKKNPRPQVRRSPRSCARRGAVGWLSSGQAAE